MKRALILLFPLLLGCPEPTEPATPPRPTAKPSPAPAGPATPLPPTALTVAPGGRAKLGLMHAQGGGVVPAEDKATWVIETPAVGVVTHDGEQVFFEAHAEGTTLLHGRYQATDRTWEVTVSGQGEPAAALPALDMSDGSKVVALKIVSSPLETLETGKGYVFAVEGRVKHPELNHPVVTPLTRHVTWSVSPPEGGRFEGTAFLPTQPGQVILSAKLEELEDSLTLTVK